MKQSTLVELWAAPDNSRLTTKQFTFRLPTHVAAKIHALCDLYPTKTRTQIVGDLLTSALADIDKAMPVFEGPSPDRDPETGEAIVELTGPRIDFYDLANKHFAEIERELGNESPKPLYR